ncbi:unnamed protein product [Vitrella brassicaformis CCMP3155]|uniref:Uncharacterized protein n=1 Tax=Vitrella brassicaformis (strain CCMP3155) TaxID=1169540 RepID=A0A0G4FYG7_VITBC|nr:unnamed protein product [Vitrella brassicaformis CCMP3155]|eukprot:CEM20400.1 unnamed protein product [Vitrella brassicaformis CCMP3155]
MKAMAMDRFFNFSSLRLSTWPSSVKSSEATVAEALAFVSTVDDDMGGTEIPFMSMTPAKGNARQVFVLTEGQVINEAEVVQLVKTEPPRVLPLGIESGVRTYLVKGMAISGNRDALLSVQLKSLPMDRIPTFSSLRLSTWPSSTTSSEATVDI